MIYDSVRDQIRTGDLIAFSGNGAFSRLIKWKTDSTISHVGVALWRQEGSVSRLEVVESTSLGGRQGVQANALSHRVETYNGKVYWAPLTPKAAYRGNTVMLAEFLTRHLGKPYDFMQAIGSALDGVESILGSIGDPDFDAFFCSELVAAAYHFAQYGRYEDPHEVTPQDLAFSDPIVPSAQWQELS